MSADVRALQAALAAEHAAIYGYGVLGAKLRGSQQQAARDTWSAHKARRDQLIGFLDTLGAKPVAAEAAYRLPVQLTSAKAATQLAVSLEAYAVGAYVALAGADDAGLRRFAAGAMQDSMARQVRWGGNGPASAFPGLDSAALSPKPE